MIIEASDADFAALIAGGAPPNLKLADTPIAPPAVVEMLRGLANKIRPTFAPSAWIFAEDGEVVGMCSVTSVPENGIIHIGYGVAPSKQGKGIATRAVGQLVEWAKGDARVTSITAETSTENIASQRTLERNGFLRTGTRVDDEDGNLICWAKDTA